MPGPVKVAFERQLVMARLDEILPMRRLEEKAKETVKYRRIAQSIAEVGVIEPLVVIRSKAQGPYMLLDGHVRLAILRDRGERETRCLLASDDEAFTYNKRISRLSSVQEHKMIRRAIERGVPEEKIAKALDVNPESIRRKVRMLNGICDETVAILKDKPCPMAVFEILRKMNPLRQIEAAELLVNANNYSVAYASAILAGTPQAQLADGSKPKNIKGITPEAVARMESELARLQEAITSIQETYGQDHLHLTVIKGYLVKLLGNARVVRYLMQHRPEFLTEFQTITEMTSTLPPEAA